MHGRRVVCRLPDGTLCTLETDQTTDAVTALSRDQGPREDVGTGFGVRTRGENDTNENVITCYGSVMRTITISVSDPIVRVRRWAVGHGGGVRGGVEDAMWC